MERGVRGADAARRQVQQGPGAGVRRADPHRRRRQLPDGAPARARHQGPVRADRGAVSGSAGPAAPAEPDRAPLLARRHDAGRRLHQRGRRGLGLVAVPGQPAEKPERAHRQHGPVRGCHRLGRHHHAARRRRAPQLRLSLDGAFALAQGAGRPRRLVRLRPLGARRLQGQRAAHRRGLRHQRHRRLSSRSTSGARRSPSARRRQPAACPTTAGSPTISRSSAAGDRRRDRVPRRLAHLRRGARRRRGQLRDRRRRVLRHAGALGLGQDHLPAPDRRLRAAGRRRHPRARPADAGRAALRPAGQHRVPGLRAVPASERAGQCRLRADGPRDGQGRSAIARRRRCWSWWRWTRTGRAARRSCPAASASAWPWPAPWCSSPRCCCSTSPWVPSTSSCASRCRAS